jgi:hypothetical protein
MTTRAAKSTPKANESKQQKQRQHHQQEPAVTWDMILPKRMIAAQLMQHMRARSSSTGSVADPPLAKDLPRAVQCLFGVYTNEHARVLQAAVQTHNRLDTWVALVGDGAAIQTTCKSSLCFLTLLDYNIRQGVVDETAYHAELQAFCKRIRALYASPHAYPVQPTASCSALSAATSTFSSCSSSTSGSSSL